jgi:hypothetical protein
MQPIMSEPHAQQFILLQPASTRLFSFVDFFLSGARQRSRWE